MKKQEMVTETGYIWFFYIWNELRINNIMCVISAYAPEEGKPAHGKVTFYEDLQDTFCRISGCLLYTSKQQALTGALESIR